METVFKFTKILVLLGAVLVTASGCFWGYGRGGYGRGGEHFDHDRGGGDYRR